MKGRRPRVLVVAGHDSSGGAGVDADREAIEALGGEAVCVVTCWTRQAGGRVEALDPVPPAEVWRAADAEDARGVDAIKLGLLPGLDGVRAAALWWQTRPRARPRVPLVLDPVVRASGGETFLDAAAVSVLRRRLAAADVVLTPNLPEAALLLERDPAGLAGRAGRLEAARELLARGARACLLKGGHGGEDPVEDLVLERGGEPVWHQHPRLPGPGLHGSGCRYASAVAAGLAAGRSLAAAAAAAGSYVAACIARAAAGE